MTSECEAYAAKAIDASVILKSSSGGIAAVIAQKFSATGGYVCGCALQEGVAKHVIIEPGGDLGALQGSKYVQSQVSKSVFDALVELVESKERVLFFGTGCQVHAVKRFLLMRVRRELVESNLYCCDLVCHGVTSPGLLGSYFTWLAKQAGDGARIEEFCFRDKSDGWGYRFSYICKYGDKRIVKKGSALSDPYYSAFLAGSLYRETCYSCAYACASRIGDVTLGDYWGIEKVASEFCDGNGVSLVLVNGAKGRYIKNLIEEEAEFLKTSIQDAARCNQNLTGPTKRPDGSKELSALVDRLLKEGELEVLFGDILRPPKTVRSFLKSVLSPRFVCKVRAAMGKARTIGG